MKKTLIGVLAGAAVAVASSAQAAAFLSIDVSGSAVTCNTSLAINAGNCGTAAGFATSANSDTIVWTPTAALNGVTFTGDLLAGGEGTGVARTAVSSFNALNTSGASRTVTVSFAVNDFTLPTGSQVSFNATQAVNNLSTGGQSVTSLFTGWGNGANTLAAGPGNGTPSVTPSCVTVASPPTNSCSTNGPVASFSRSGNFDLNGVQSFVLSNGANVNASATIVTQAVPEPASMLLLGTGLVALARTARRRQRTR